MTGIPTQLGDANSSENSKKERTIPTVQVTRTAGIKEKTKVRQNFFI